MSRDLINADRKGNWQALPEVDLDSATRAHLIIAMPGTQSFLDRHEWIRHGTCFGRGDPQTYFQEALSLLDEVNGSAVQALFAGNIGKEITVGEVRTTFDTAFGSRRGSRPAILQTGRFSPAYYRDHHRSGRSARGQQ